MLCNMHNIYNIIILYDLCLHTCTRVLQWIDVFAIHLLPRCRVNNELMNWSIKTTNDQFILFTDGSLWTVKPWASRRPVHQSQSFALDGWFNAGAYQQGAAGTGFKFRGEFDWFSGRDHEGKFFDNWSCHSYSRALRKAWFVHIHPISTLFLSTFCRCICFKHWPGLLVLMVIQRVLILLLHPPRPGLPWGTHHLGATQAADERPHLSQSFPCFLGSQATWLNGGWRTKCHALSLSLSVCYGWAQVWFGHVWPT